MNSGENRHKHGLGFGCSYSMIEMNFFDIFYSEMQCHGIDGWPFVVDRLATTFDLLGLMVVPYHSEFHRHDR